jgi:hypothetical protein
MQSGFKFSTLNAILLNIYLISVSNSSASCTLAIIFANVANFLYNFVFFFFFFFLGSQLYTYLLQCFFEGRISTFFQPENVILTHRKDFCEKRPLIRQISEKHRTLNQQVPAGSQNVKEFFY